MPSGKTHDAITFLLTVPIFIAAWSISGWILAIVIAAAFLFGGLMFGPDLDTRSVQYSRWGVVRFLWFPYQQFFKHRSRWSHGLVFGTLIRVVYFAGVLTLVSFLITFLVTAYIGSKIPDLFEFTETWNEIGRFVENGLGQYGFYSIFVGLWLGAASHTVADIGGTYLKTGRIRGFL